MEGFYELNVWLGFQFRRFVGILVIVFAINLIFYLFLTASDFDVFSMALSDFGRFPETRIAFNVGLAISNMLQLIFVTYVLDRFKIKLTSLSAILFYVGYLSLAFAAMFPLGTYDELHRFFAYLSFGNMLTAWVVFGYMLEKKGERKLGALNIALGIGVTMLFFFLWGRFDALAIPELVFFVFLGIWNVLMTFPRSLIQSEVLKYIEREFFGAENKAAKMNSIIPV